MQFSWKRGNDVKLEMMAMPVDLACSLDFQLFSFYHHSGVRRDQFYFGVFFSTLLKCTLTRSCIC